MIFLRFLTESLSISVIVGASCLDGGVPRFFQLLNFLSAPRKKTRQAGNPYATDPTFSRWKYILNNWTTYTRSSICIYLSAVDFYNVTQYIEKMTAFLGFPLLR